MKGAGKLVILSTAVLSAVCTSPAWSRQPFLGDRERGYFWYEDPAPAEEPEEIVEAPEPPPPPPPPPLEPMETIDEAPMAPRPVPGSVEWVRSAIPKLLEAAMNDPSPENVERFFLVQQLALNMATEFSEMARFVTMGHPILDEQQRRPQGTSMALDQADAARIILRRTLSRLSERVGIWFFIDGNCVSCPTTGRNLLRMNEEYGLEVRFFSMDGTPLFGVEEAEVFADDGAARQLGIRSGGTIVFVEPPDYATILAHGVISLTEIEDRIIAIAYRQGLISDDEYAMTRPVKPIPDPLFAGPVPVSKEAMTFVEEADALLADRKVDMNNIFPTRARR